MQRQFTKMNKIINDTKWGEIRLAMYSLKDKPSWRTKDIVTAFVSPWDTEWFYHFSVDGYNTIEWLEISFRSEADRVRILAELKKIHVPGEELDGVFRIYGYSKIGQAVDYI